METDPLGYTFLIAFDEEVNQKDAISKCKKYCEEMVKSIQEVMKCTMAIGISQVFRNSYDMALAYRQSVTACENNLEMKKMEELLNTRTFASGRIQHGK